MMIIKKFNELGGKKMDEQSEKFNKDLENIKKNQTEMRNTITEGKNTPEGIYSRLCDVEKRIRELEDRAVEIPRWTEKNKQKKKELKKIRII